MGPKGVIARVKSIAALFTFGFVEILKSICPVNSAISTADGHSAGALTAGWIVGETSPTSGALVLGGADGPENIIR
jgi:hypothetical protein